MTRVSPGGQPHGGLHRDEIECQHATESQHPNVNMRPKVNIRNARQRRGAERDPGGPGGVDAHGTHPRFFDTHLGSAVGAIDYVRGSGD